MLTWSGRRRFVYSSIVLIILLAAVGGALWRFRPQPSCTDGRKNQNELGVDCGGTCAAVCVSEVVPLKVIWTRALPVAPDQYDVATLVVNSNRGFKAESFSYLLRLIDQQGILITTRQGEAYLNPGENFIIHQNRIAVGRREPARAIFEVVGSPTWRRVAADLPEFSLKQLSFENTPFPRLLAEITNDTNTDWRGVEVVALLSDTAGNAFAVSSTIQDLLPAGGRTELAFTWPTPFILEQPVINFYTHVEAF